MSDYLPEDIILQILHNLPVKSLMRFTCVCKTWHSLIKNPSFISTHLTLSISSNTHLLLFRLCSEQSEHYSLHFDNNQQLSQYMVLDFPFESYNHYFCVTGCVNGIICLVDNLATCTSTFILWNPLIKKSIILPKPSVTFMNPASYKDFIGFGFDSKTNDYKVLRIVHNVFNEEDEEAEDEPFMELELYSLNTNAWKTMTCVAPKYEFDKRHMQLQASVNGVVHWTAFQYMGDWVYRNVVLGFDMGDEVFCEFNLPQILANVIGLNLYVTKYGDSSIAVIRNSYYIPFHFHTWVRKEYCVVESWTKLFSFREPGGGEGIWTVLAFRKSGEVLMQTNDRKIVLYDPQNKEVKDLGLRNKKRLAFVDGYVESLVLLENANAAYDVIEDGSDDSMSSMDDSSDDGSDDEMVAV